MNSRNGNQSNEKVGWTGEKSRWNQRFKIQDSRFQNAAGALATRFEAKPNWHGRSEAKANRRAEGGGSRRRAERGGKSRWVVTAARGRVALPERRKTLRFKRQEAAASLAVQNLEWMFRGWTGTKCRSCRKRCPARCRTQPAGRWRSPFEEAVSSFSSTSMFDVRCPPNNP